MSYKIIRTDGTEETRDERPTHHAIREAIHCDTLDTVNLGHATMYVDDNSVAAGKEVNEKATKLYHSVCKPGTTWQIRGDVVVTRDRYFGRE